ncbi:MAG: hypothetical protein WDA16_03210 [Candidatus Thermoplasmatota archaeon]
MTRNVASGATSILPNPPRLAAPLAADLLQLDVKKWTNSTNSA